MAVATAAPPLDPPGVRSGFQGSRVTPCSGLSVRILQPSSGVVVLPKTIPPARRTRAIASASAAGTFPANAREPCAVRMPAVLIRSLAEIGKPCSGPSGAPAARSRSARSAARRAASRSTSAKAFVSASNRSIRSSTASMTSRHDRSPRRIRAASSTAGVCQISLKTTPGASPPAALDAVVAAESQVLLALHQHPLGDLLRRPLGQRVDELQIAWHLERREAGVAVREDPFDGNAAFACLGLKHDVGLDLFAANLVRDRNDRRLEHFRKSAQDCFDFARSDVFAAAANHVLPSPDDVVEAPAVLSKEISG